MKLRTTHITHKGRELADAIGRTDQEARLVCSAIARAATTAQRIAEELCNGPHWVNAPIPQPEYGRRMDRWQAQLEARDAKLEARIGELVKLLGPGYGVILNGDPRGCVVKLTTPDARSNDFGREGVCVQ